MVFSTLPFYGAGDGEATWKQRFATEGKELRSFFFDLQKRGQRVIICSGNAHAQIMNRFSRPGYPDLFEFVSSGTDSLGPDNTRALPSDRIIRAGRAVREAHAFVS